MLPKAPLDPAVVLARFSPATQAWFTNTFDAPTSAQLQGWDAIADGQHTLVLAPTGSGKTLAAFLWALDSLASRPIRGVGEFIMAVAITRMEHSAALVHLADEVRTALSTCWTEVAMARD